MRIPLLIALSVLFGNVALAQKPAKEPAKKDAAKPAKDAKQDS